MSAFKAVACVVFLLVISASHSRSMNTMSILCEFDHFIPNVVRPTLADKSRLLFLLNFNETKIKQLDDLNVTSNVCGVLAAHETATRVGRNTMFQKKVRTDSILVQFFIGGPQSNSTEHFDPNFEASLDYLRKYCLYHEFAIADTVFKFKDLLTDLGGCKTEQAN
ncbi:uncharacterized protein LOC135340666 [Halichondria panicea]|uniref:uncharacterized protein LOC135340666 n=1 Tax=Halichondria panicea TaxID=6063 RepID=UPI00312B70C4